jgi:hypothetical protein
LNIGKSFSWAEPTTRGPKRASTRATVLNPAPAHHRAGHQAVTVLTIERALAPVTAGHCRPMWVHRAYPGVDSSREESSTHFASPSIPRTYLCLCSTLSPPVSLLAITTTDHRSSLPSKLGNGTAVFPSTCSSLFERKPPANNLCASFSPPPASST